MNLRELVEQSDKRPITPASIDADADVMMYLWSHRHAICELIEAATEWDKATSEYLKQPCALEIAKLTQSCSELRAALAKLNGGKK